MFETLDLDHKDQNINKPAPRNAQYDFTNKWFDTDKLNQGEANAVDTKNKTTKTTKNKFLSQWTISFIIYPITRIILI